MPDEHGWSYQTAFAEVSDASFIYDPTDGAVVEVNAAATELTGYSEESPVGRSVSQFGAGTQADIEQAAGDIVEQPAERDRRFEWAVERADGDVCTTEVSLHRTTVDGADRVLAIVRDITDRVQREATLRRMHEVGAEAGMDSEETVRQLLDVGREHLECHRAAD